MGGGGACGGEEMGPTAITRQSWTCSCGSCSWGSIAHACAVVATADGRQSTCPQPAPTQESATRERETHMTTRERGEAHGPSPTECGFHMHPPATHLNAACSAPKPGRVVREALQWVCSRARGSTSPRASPCGASTATPTSCTPPPLLATRLARDSCPSCLGSCS